MLRTAILLAMATAGVAANYEVVPLKIPNPAYRPMMSGINNSGQVAQIIYNGTYNQAFVGTVAGSTAVPLPSGWTETFGQAVNASGQVTGYGFSGPNTQAFIGDAAGSTAIPMPAGWTYANGFGVNNSGQVAGNVTNAQNVTQAFVGTVAGCVVLPLAPGWSGAFASGINASGQVAGTASIGGISQAFIGTTTGSATIPMPAGWLSSGAVAINDLGQVVGTGFDGEVQQAFIATVAGSTVIPQPPHTTNVYVSSINNLSVVIGYAVVSGSLAGWIWDATNGTRLLNTLVPSGWNVSTAISISDNGLILAQASHQNGASQYVELIPSRRPAGHRLKPMLQAEARATLFPNATEMTQLCVKPSRALNLPRLRLAFFTRLGRRSDHL
jgi:hypothetical protein